MTHHLCPGCEQITLPLSMARCSFCDEGDHPMNKVVAHVQRLAAGKPNVGYTISSRYTGRREWHWDSRNGVYEELLPLVDVDAQLIQQAFQKGTRAPAR